MAASPNVLRAAALAAVCLCLPAGAAGQAFTPPERVGSATLSWQLVDNTGHRFSDGFLVARGQSRTSSLLLEADFGITDRLAVTAGLPFVFAKYTGALPSFSRLPVDECQCWHSGFQDVSTSLRYRFGTRAWAVTPMLRYTRPTRDYRYQGEAVVGRNLNEAQVGLNAAVRLPGRLRGASLQTGFVYAFVEKPIPSISIDRSNGFMDVGYAVTDRFFVRGGANWQQTHGGLRAGSMTGIPFPFPGELNTAERTLQRDRLLKVKYWQASGGVSYSLGEFDVFASLSKYVWGRDAHNGQAYTLGASWYFDLSR